MTVLISEIQPRKRRHELLHNQRGLILAAALRARTDAIVATLYVPASRMRSQQLRC